MALRRVTTSAARSRPFAWLVALLERLDRERPDLLRVLTYHRVESNDAEPSAGIGISVDGFAEQMRYLKARCRVLSVHELIDTVRDRRELPRRSVLVTFDDGYRDFRANAWPVLASLGLSSTLFVPTAFPGEPGRHFWWDDLQHALARTGRRDSLETPIGSLPLGTASERNAAYSRLRHRVKQLPHVEAMAWVAGICRELGVSPPPADVLRWDELRELAREGVIMGSHTRTHPLLTRIPSEQARLEVRESLRDLERELGTAPPPILAYPAGAFDDCVVRMLAEEGIVLGFTTVRGANSLRTAHPLKLRRINVGRRTPLGLMRAQLTGWSLGLNRFHPLTAPGAANGGHPDGA